MQTKTRVFVYGALIANLVVGIGFCVVSVAILSFFFGMIGIYNIVLGISKICALTGYATLPRDVGSVANASSVNNIYNVGSAESIESIASVCSADDIAKRVENVGIINSVDSINNVEIVGNIVSGNNANSVDSWDNNDSPTSVNSACSANDIVGNIYSIEGFDSLKNANSVESIENVGSVASVDCRSRRILEIARAKRLAKWSLAASLLFVSFAVVTTFFVQDRADYNDALAIVIAAVAFAKLIAGLVGYVRAKNYQSLVVGQICLINVADGFVSLALAQRALLLMSHVDNVYWYNGIGAIVMGVVSVMISIYMLVRRYS